MLSKCPLKRNHGPAIDMWSVVHFPLALISNLAPVRFSPSQGAKGVSNWRRSESSRTLTLIPLPSSGGAKYPLSSASKPWGGSSCPVGGSKRTSSPSELMRVSCSGSKSKRPEIATAATISGEATKAWVFGFPSLRLEKLRLKEWTILFFSFLSAPARAHCPIHGPQALVNILASKSSKIDNKPSRSAV